MKLNISILLLVFGFTLNAQEQPAKVKEYGIGLSSFNSFSLQYRWGNEKRLYRINGTLGGHTDFGKSSSQSSYSGSTMSDSQSSNAKTPLSFTCGLNFSTLKLKPINDNFGLMYGINCGVNYNITLTNSTTADINVSSSGSASSHGIVVKKGNSQEVRPNMGLVLGAFYKINSSFLLYAEIVPNIYYDYTVNITNITTTSYFTNTIGETDVIKSHNNSFGLSNIGNSAAALTIVYRITK